MFPLPVQSHVNSMLKLAQLLSLANLKVTFLNSIHNHQRMAQYTDIEAHFGRYPGFRFEVIPDGLPDDHPRAGGDWMLDLFQGLKATAGPILREIVSGAHTDKVTCLVVDGVMSFGYDIANQAGLPVIGFRLISACCIWAYFCIPNLIEAGEMPFDFEDNQDMDKLVHNIPGMDSFLRHRDLPSFCRVKDISDPTLQHLIIDTQRARQAHSLILNTFDDLEGPILSLIHAHCSNVYSIGPLHAHLNYRLSPEESSLSNTSCSSLWEVDQSCISWLDQKPTKSVVYVSFGSLTNLTRDQFVEFWAGLVMSNVYFLWVVRPNMIPINDPDWAVPNEVEEGTKERGCMVSWAPQEEVLSHRAIGGFLTHSGWNSTLESIVSGVPMLCWPYFADQQVNSRYVSEVWKIGLDMKDICDRTIVEKMVTDLMAWKRDELERSMAITSHLAKKSIMKGGSSYCNLDRLIEDIKSMSNKALKVEEKG